MATNHSLWANAMNNITLVFPEEQISNASSDNFAKDIMLRLEEKSGEWMIALVSKVCKAEELVPNTCAGYFGDRKGMLVLTRTRKVYSL